MADASGSELPRRAALEIAGTWRRLNFEQRIAGIGALLLVVSTFGPFSFVEAAIVLIGLSVLFLLRKRAEGREFHIPFGDGGVIAAAGAWSGVLIMIRLFDRPLGQNLLALVCAAVLLIAGIAERRKRPPDDLPGPDAEAHQRGPDAVDWEEPSVLQPRPRARTGAAASTSPLGEPRRSDDDTSPLGEPRPRDDDTAPLGEPRPRVGASDAATEVRGSRRRRSRTRARASEEADTNPLGEPRPPAGRDPGPNGAEEPGAQLELATDPPPQPPPAANDPLPPPEFRLPGDEPKPPES
jgi:hypothetical protein